MKSLAKLLQNFKDITVLKKDNKYYSLNINDTINDNILEATPKGIVISGTHYTNAVLLGINEIDVDILAKFYSLIFYPEGIGYKNYLVKSRFKIRYDQTSSLKVRFIRNGIDKLVIEYRFDGYLHKMGTPILRTYGVGEMFFQESNAKNVFSVLKKNGVDFE